MTKISNLLLSFCLPGRHLFFCNEVPPAATCRFLGFFFFPSNVQSDLVICKALSAFTIRVVPSVPTPLRPKAASSLTAGMVSLLSSTIQLLQPISASGETRLFCLPDQSRNTISQLSSRRVLESPDYYFLLLRLYNFV